MPEDKKPAIKKFDKTKNLSAEELKFYDFVTNRISELKESRKEKQFNVQIEKIWEDADKDYAPHRLNPERGKRAIAVDEDKGWRGQMITLGKSNWQSDLAQSNPFVKIQVALSILIDQNPEGVFMAASKKFKATTVLIQQLYKRSWEIAKSKQQLKLYIFNLVKYGWAVGRTYPLKLTRKIRVPIEYNEDNPSETKYEEKEVVEFNDIMRENLDPWNVWIDDMAKPNDQFSTRDWCWRKIYAFDSATEVFGKYKNWKYVTPGGITTAKLDERGETHKKFKETELIEVYFYENKLKDLFMVIANNIPVIIEPLPVADTKGIKKLSCWYAYWNLRHAECLYGIGIYEAIRYDSAALDRVRNMTLDQLVLSIYKMFFYQGTQSVMETGDITIVPGVGKQVLNPKDINWLQIPGPGKEAWLGLDILKRDLDEASGITDPLMGVIVGKTAFEVAQAKETALKRLKTPLENVTDSLDNEAYITISLIQLLYSVPETYSISDSNLIDQYLNEIQSDPELYERTEEIGENGEVNKNFTAKVFREFPLNIEEDEDSNLIETKETAFFRIKPRFLKWEGIINVKSQSVLSPSKQIDKALTQDMYNILIPLLVQPPQIYSKIAKDIVKLYDKDPKDILPDFWLDEQLMEQPLIVPAEKTASPTEEQPQINAPQFVSNEKPVGSQGGLVQKLMSRITSPFR